MLISPATIGAIQQDPIRRIFKQASLDLRFADDKSLVDATTGASLVTFTRASSGTFVGSDGVLRTAVTNLLLQSEDFSTTWTKDSNAVVTTNVATAPNGSVTADKFAVGTSTFPQIAQAVTSTVSLTHSFSVYVKAAGLNFIQLRVRNAGASTNYFRAVFNLTTGAVTSAIINGTGVIVSATAVSAGDGWWRCTLTGTADTTGTSIQPLAILATDANGTLATSSNSAATDGVLLWGAQLEQSATVGEYVPTTSAINSAPRFDHNPTTGESLGLLVEEARTNLATNSESLTLGFTQQNTTVTSDATTAPDGTTTADLSVPNTTSASHASFRTNITFAVSTSYAMSVFVKPSGYTNFQLSFTSGFNNTNAWANFILVGDGSLGFVGTSGTAAIQALSNGWYRCSLVATSGVSAVNGGPALIVLDSNRNGKDPSFAGNNTSGIFIWGVQLEAGALPTSYIPTTTATVTRAADVASITGANFSSWYNQTEGTVFAEMDRNTAISSSSTVVSINDNSSNNRLYNFRQDSASALTVISATGGTLDGALGVTLANTSNRNRVAAAQSLNNLAAAANGGTVLSDTSVAMPTVTQVQIGNVTGTSYFNGTIRRICFWPTRLPANILQSITQ